MTDQDFAVLEVPVSDHDFIDDFADTQDFGIVHLDVADDLCYVGGKKRTVLFLLDKTDLFACIVVRSEAHDHDGQEKGQKIDDRFACFWFHGESPWVYFTKLPSGLKKNPLGFFDVVEGHLGGHCAVGGRGDDLTQGFDDDIAGRVDTFDAGLHLVVDTDVAVFLTDVQVFDEAGRRGRTDVGENPVAG